MSDKLNEKRLENEPRINAALARLGELAGGGSPFELKFYAGDEQLDAAVAADNSWAEGLLYLSVADYLEELVKNVGAMPPAIGRALDAAASRRVVMFSIDESAGGLVAPVSSFNDGMLELLCRAQSLKTNQSGWTDIGLDLPKALRVAVPEAMAEGSPESAPVEAAAPPASDDPTPADGPQPTGEPVETAFGLLPPALAAGLEQKQAAIAAHLAALTEFIGDGRPWTVEFAADAAEMDAEVTREADYMKAQLFGTLEEFLGFINHNVRRDHSPELLASAAPARCIVFKFVDIDDMPRRYLGAFQAIVTDQKLFFVGPAGDFKSNGGGASRIGSDLERAVMTAKGEDGPTEKELKLAEALGAIAGSSSRSKGSGGGEGKTCTKCKGKKFNTCNACHGKGGSCKNCKGSGLSSYKCSGCGGTGVR